ncbi:MAG: PilW family protein [Azonexus sp.]|jgi:type IV pilus assembly protein PilW|uniref:PilW family protein n=1 Tax=Azonexus sp. TaxID=1872668 RepID=UPI00282E3979|nr:PilW family protein [Azonexus sp.]MDR0775521.1 PilW family protein [Azonexus sp.]
MKQHPLLGRRMPMHPMRGLSLVEVMVTLAIGMIVTLGIVGIMLTNRQNLRITEGLSESQENARMAFELIARDVRQARDTGCGTVPVTNALNAGDNWWEAWWPIRGFAGDEDTSDIGAAATGTNEGERVADTEALQLLGSGEARIVKTITADGTTINLKSPAGTLAGGPVIVCDLLTASLHTAGAAGANSITATPAVADGAPDLGNPPFQVSRLTAVMWYIGNNGRATEGGRSLYRISLQSNGTTATEEILPGVVNMQMSYHLNDTNNFVGSGALAAQADWDKINAIQLTLTTESTQRNVTSDAATDSEFVSDSDGRIRRDITHVISLRNTI